jgi:hypothetical protein
MTDSERIYAADILRAERITDRCLRNWISRDRFPAPDGNIHGRNYWRSETYQKWREDVAAGRYAQARRPPGQRGGAATAA